MKRRVKVLPLKSNIVSSRPKLRQTLLQRKMLLSRTEISLERQPLKMRTSNSNKDMDPIKTTKVTAIIAQLLLMTVDNTTSTLTAVIILINILALLRV